MDSFFATFGVIDGEPLYRPVEVAKILECDLGHIYDLIRERKLTASNIGTSRKPVWRIRQSYLLRFLADNENNIESPSSTAQTPKPKAKPVDTLRDKAAGLNDSFAARYAARQATNQKGA